MKLHTGHIFKKTIIILMTVFLCLPCSVKREIKQALNVPVAPLEHSQKTNKAVICHTFTNDGNQKLSVSPQQKDVQKPNHIFDFAFQQTNLLQHHIFTFSEIKFSAPVPIYILHEQYLI
jgi:hypothetical protein